MSVFPLSVSHALGRHSILASPKLHALSQGIGRISSAIEARNSFRPPTSRHRVGRTEVRAPVSASDTRPEHDGARNLFRPTHKLPPPQGGLKSAHRLAGLTRALRTAERGIHSAPAPPHRRKCGLQFAKPLRYARTHARSAVAITVARSTWSSGQPRFAPTDRSQAHVALLARR